MARVTVLGMGAMGSRMAVNLLKAGHQVTVWNRSPEACTSLAAAGAAVALTPREAVSRAEVAIAMLRDDIASRAVWCDARSGALQALPPGAIGIESSTLTVAWVRDLSARFETDGRGFLDAPVVGSRPQAEAGQLIHLVGGDEAVIARAETVLRSIGAATHHAGPAGHGMALKLAANALFGIQVAAMAELMGFLDKAGLDHARALDILAATPLVSPAARGAATQMLSASFPPMFPVDLLEKDFGCLRATAAAAGATVPVADAVHAIFAQAIERGFGDDNLTGVVRLYR